MIKNSTLHFVYQNYPNQRSEVIDIDRLFVHDNEFKDVLDYLNTFKYEAPEKLVDEILEKVGE